jgi:tryptophan synthase alpha chain
MAEPGGPARAATVAAARPGPAPVERLEGRLAELRAAGRAALVAYGVAGYPDLAGSLAAFRAMAAAGADVLEVGPPYSDPLIDGPVIQRAVSAALAAGTRLDDVLGLVAGLTAGVDAPVVLLVYYNLVAHRGPERFAAELAAAGACGAVVPDLPPEEAGAWLAAAGRAGIAPIFLAAPTSSDARLAAVAAAGRGFVYAQASLGVTGLRASLQAGIDGLVARVRAHTDLPVCCGIGVSDPEQAAAVARFADGAIVGTALVRRLGDAGLDGLAELTAELAEAVHGARA